MLKPMSRTCHISYKKEELPLLQRERELGEKLYKNRSDTYKYCLNKVYLDVMLKEEDGKQFSIC